MKPKPHDHDPGGLDALLDTITNVVGVLIIVMVVSLLSIRDAVTRVEKLNPIRARDRNEKIRDAQARLSQLDLTLEQLRTQWLSLRTPYMENEHRLQALSTTMTETASELSNPQAVPDPRDRAGQVKRRREQLIRLAEEIDRLEHRLERLLAPPDPKPTPRLPKVTVARVPDPTPAPRGAKPLVFLCRYGRMVQFEPDAMARILHEGIASAGGPAGGWRGLSLEDLDRLIQYFETHEIGKDGLRWKLQLVRGLAEGGQQVQQELRANLVWTRRDIGETPDDLRHASSRYQLALRAAPLGRVYGKFYVWGDSFAPYTVARALIDGYQIPAGWVAQQGAAEYRVVLFSARSSPRVAQGSAGSRPTTPAARPFTPVGAGGGFGTRPAVGLGGGAPSLQPAIGIGGSSPGVDFVD